MVVTIHIKQLYWKITYINCILKYVLISHREWLLAL